ncbi:trimethyllysine dioxygenase, mitochondrial-like [Sitodiplosis mosellana]|uniref:trimethyllysine dioxygenase, mitochondrial-like n=1 Tax=Sitodiplosis mosellana TaxID=263140 RepID=UPI002443ECB0|nr:trimethyllysine dioxygenase, mitochondrial-like [Sitodiplosis mosellana]
MYTIESPERKLKLCALPTCKGKRYDLVHKFPMNNERAQQWIDIIDLPELKKLPIDQVRKRFFICSKHFRPQDYKNCESRSLNTTAYPRLLLKLTDEEATEPCPQSVSVEEFQVQECDFGVQETTIHLTESNTHITTTEKTSPKPIEYILCASANDQPVLLRRNQNIEAEIVIQKPFRIQAPTVLPTPPPAPKPIIVKTSLKPANAIISTPQPDSKNLSKEIILKRNANYTIESVRKKIILNESNAPKTYPQKVSVPPEEKNRGVIVIHHNELPNPLQVCSFWLRDHCRCTNCFGDTLQRKINLAHIPLDVEPTHSKTENNLLRITWSDGHKSSYDVLELNERLNSKFKLCPIKHIPWSAADMLGSDYASVTLNDYLCNEEIAKAVVASLVKFGCAFIRNVPANLQSTEIAIRRLFPIQKTLFGEMWSFSDNKAHNDIAYTNEALLAHTDNTYFTDAAGLKILHCTSRDGSGGESFLVDGFNVLKRLREQNQEAYEYLSKTSITSEYIEDGYHFKHSAPAIIIDPKTKEPNQIRFNMNDRAPFNDILQDEMLKFYKHYRALAIEIQRGENEWHFKLEPGTVCIFDNWRILHGRTEYTGRRQMVGCYVSRSEFHSVARRYAILS